MKKYGNFVVFPTDYMLEWVIVVKYRDFKFDLKAGSINAIGEVVKEVRTLEKAIRTVKEYERRMGRT